MYVIVLRDGKREEGCLLRLVGNEDLRVYYWGMDEGERGEMKWNEMNEVVMNEFKQQWIRFKHREKGKRKKEKGRISDYYCNCYGLLLHCPVMNWLSALHPILRSSSPQIYPDSERTSRAQLNSSIHRKLEKKKAPWEVNSWLYTLYLPHGA